jgi:head-tail adaptor
MIGPRVGIGARHVWVTVEHAGPTKPDGDGGYTTEWLVGIPPIWQVSIVAATALALERLAVGTVTATATHVLSGPYRPDLTLRSRVLVEGRRVFQVVGLQNVEERGQELVIVCVEQPTDTPYPMPGGGAAA